MNQETINKFIEQAAGEMDIGGFIVPSINAPVILLDELKEGMFIDNPPFAVLYWDEPDGRSFILFSKDDDERVDLGELVKPYRGAGSADMAAFKTPPQKEVAGEFIPLALEFPPDEIEVLGLYFNMNKTLFVKNLYHKRDGKFAGGTKPVAWAYMPELPDTLSDAHDNRVVN